MKKRLLTYGAALVACLCTFMVQAQTVTPYLPQLDNFGGSAANVTTFLPPTSDYTLEVDGTQGAEISIAGGVYTYTPTADGKVRFAQKNGKVYVYEGNVYKTTLTPVDKATYPNIFAETNSSSNQTGIYNVLNLLQNPGFETIPNNVWKCYDGNGANIAITNVGTSGTSIRAKNTIEGSNAMLFHQTARYLTQSIPANKIKPNSRYKVAFKYHTNDLGQNGVVFRACLGTAERGTDVATAATRTTLNVTTVYDYVEYFSTGDNVSTTDPVWFLVERTSGYSVSPQKLEFYDDFTLVEASIPTGVEGGANPMYLAGTAYAPEFTPNYAGGDYYDITNYIVNPSFETNALAPWTTTGTNDTGVKPNSNATYTTAGVDGSYLFNTWNNGSGGELKQTIIDLPNGKYSLVALVAGDKNNLCTAFLNSATTAHTIVGDKNTFEEVKVEDVIVTNNTIQLGIKAGTWYKADNFRLYFYGYDPTAAIALLSDKITYATDNLVGQVMQTSIATSLTTALSQAQNAIDNTPTEAALTAATAALLEAIGNAEPSISAYASLLTAISDATTNVATYDQNEDKVNINAAIAAAQDVYNTHTADVSGVAFAKAALATDLLTFQIDNASTTKPANLTSKIINPDFEANGGSVSGWTTSLGIYAGANAVFTGSPSPNHVMDGDPTAVTMGYQTVSGLPGGIYRVKAVARGRVETSALMYIGAVAGSTFTSEGRVSVQVDRIGDTGGTLTNGWNQYETPDVIIPNNASITLGIYFDGDCGWSSVDNFELIYYGAAVPATILTNKTSLSFNYRKAIKTFTVAGIGLEDNITILPPNGIQLTQTSIAPNLDGEVGETTITATFDKTADINANIVISSTNADDVIITVTADATYQANLMYGWDANGAADKTPSQAGWIASETVTWGVANAGGDAGQNAYYRTNPAGYTGGHTFYAIPAISNNVIKYAYPIELTAGQKYKFNAKNWVRNGQGTARTVTYAIADGPTATGTIVSSGTISGNKSSFDDISFIFTAPSTGIYYLVRYSENKAADMQDASAALSIVEFSDFVIGSSETRTKTDYTSAGYGDIIIQSDENSTGQLTIPAGETLQVNGVVKYQKTFTPKEWYPIGFPFAIASVNAFGEVLDYYDGNGQAGSATKGDFWLKSYNGEVFDYTTAFVAGKGYAIQFPTAFAGEEVTFTSVANPVLSNTNTPTPILASGYTLVANPSVANTTSIAGAENYYMYNYSENGKFNVLYQGNNELPSGTSLKPFEAMIAVKDVVNLRAVSVEAQETAINGVDAANDQVIEVHYYNLQGIEIPEPTTNGIYLVKKVYESKKVEIVKTFINKK